jgi:hypothetical protein
VRQLLLVLSLLVLPFALPACKSGDAAGGDGTAAVETPTDATPKITLSWTTDCPTAPEGMVASVPGMPDMHPSNDFAANKYTLVVTYDAATKKAKVDFTMAIPAAGKPEAVTFVYTCNGQVQVHDEKVK